MENFTWEGLAKAFTEQRQYCVGYSPLYEAIFTNAAKVSQKAANKQSLTPPEQAFIDLLSTEWETRQIRSGIEASMLLTATIHAAVLRGEADGLKQYFATVGGNFDPNKDKAGLEQALGEFYQKPGATARKFLRTGIMQTNEIRRGVMWMLPAMVMSSLNGQAPITLVDLGCSAGLHLASDAYTWRWAVKRGPGGERTMTAGLPSVDQEFRFGIESDVPVMLPAGEIPKLNIARRVGFDLNPPDPNNPDDLLSLKACIWGDQPERMKRMEQALETIKTVKPDIEIRKEDAISAARTLHTLITPETRLLLVYNMTVTMYMSDAEYAQLKANITESFSQLPGQVEALWVEFEQSRHDEPPTYKNQFPLKISNFVDAHHDPHHHQGSRLRMTYYAYADPHPRTITLLPGWDYLWL